jgi:ABC-type dipeptide/oligopeptide/nickel transport system permease subunit
MLGKRLFDRLLKSPSGLIGFVLTVGLVLMALLAPILIPMTPHRPELFGAVEASQLRTLVRHGWFGTRNTASCLVWVADFSVYRSSFGSVRACLLVCCWG